MNEISKNVKFVDYMYVIDEIEESMSSSISKMKEIVDEQESLCNYLEKAEDKDKYQSFIENLKKANVNTTEQIRVLEYRLHCFEIVQNKLKDEENQFLTTMLLEALGVVNKEAKSLEERENNHEDIKEVKSNLC